jgi:head-tail adaptor
MSLTAKELAAMRSVIADLLPETCSVLTLTKTSDGQGGFTETWGTASTTTCRVDWKSGIETIQGGAIQPYRRCMITLPYDTTVTEGSRLAVGSDTYAVTGVDNGKSWDACLRVEVDKI